MFKKMIERDVPFFLEDQFLRPGDGRGDGMDSVMFGAGTGYGVIDLAFGVLGNGVDMFNEYFDEGAVGPYYV